MVPDNLYIGADFVHGNNDSVIVTLFSNDADWTGSLYFIPPEFPDSIHFVFNNKDPIGSTVNLSRFFNIPVGQTVVFMYKVISGGNSTDKLPKYTGPNDQPFSPYFSQADGDYGHRFSVAGRIDETTVEFGFEDRVNGSDYDFNDIVFHVKGLSLAVEISVDPPIATPPGREFFDSLDVSLTTATPGAAIFFTLDGSAPTPASQKYTKPITLTSTATLKAIASIENTNSSVTTEHYTLASIAPPRFDPAGREFFEDLQVSITSATPGVSIHYTTDGSSPTPSSPAYTKPLTLSSTTTLKAIAVINNATSSITTEVYTLAFVSPPQFDPPGKEFTGMLEVSITTATPGASLYFTTDGTTPTRNSRQYTVPVSITETTTFKAIAVKGLGVSTVATEQYMGRISVKKSWIIDENQDGRADKIFIEFDTPLSSLPAAITDIHWPDNAGDTRTASANPPTPGVNSIRFPDTNNTTTVVVDLAGEPFAFGATEASTANPPTLTLPDGAKYEIEDGVKPIVLAVEKEPSSGYYILQDDAGNRSQGLFPNKVTITLSEPIRIPLNSGEAPWNTLFQYVPKKGGNSQPLISEKAPIVSADSLTWVLMVPEVAGGLQAGDSVYFNPHSGAADKKGNPPNDYKAVSEGEDYQSDGADAYLVETIIGKSSDKLYEDEPIQGESVPVVDKNGYVIAYDQAFVERKEWIPPSTLVNPLCAGTPTESQTFVEYPANCLSSVLVLTSETYTAEVKIFSNLGHTVHNSIQAFGDCGEMNNPERKHASGKTISYLIWNQKDQTGKFVGSGVYVWKIKLSFTVGKSRTVIKKQGIVRNAQYPDAACATGH